MELSMDWFQQVFGAKELDGSMPLNKLIEVSESGGLTFLTSSVNQKSFQAGRLEIPTLSTLRARFNQLCYTPLPTQVYEEIANVQTLHLVEDNVGAMFQVASQVNLLEMASPHATPEDGVTIYQYDRTQGPACAIAAGAGTVYRNYFHPHHLGRGQSKEQQINTLDELHSALSTHGELWTTRNGYILPNHDQLKVIYERLSSLHETERDILRGLCKIGFQWDTEVTLKAHGQLINQAYCSALPLGYSQGSISHWEPFARLVLEAAYESVLIASAINALEGGSRKVFLTTIGGGVFRNPDEWIYEAIQRGLTIVKDCGLEVYMVSYGSSKQATQELIRAWANS
jgi:hypothetical protein